jgi:TolB-like protein/Flp pilus assembly protein TadD
MLIGFRRLSVALCVCASVRPCVLAAQCPDGAPPPCRGLAPRGVAGPPSGSIAVLYFETRDTADAYLADGLTEEIATSLGRVARLQIKSPSAVRRAQHQAAGDLRAIGRMLNVFWVVEGSVRRGEGQLRVSVRLVNAANETATWSDAYSRPASGVLSIQEDIARQVATNVAGVLAPAERSRLAQRPTRSPEAYDHFLRGNYYLAQRSATAAARAIAEYGAAIRLDPTFAAAHARSSLTRSLTLDWGWPHPGVSKDTIIARASAAAAAARRLDSLSADAWMAEAFARSHEHPRTYEGVIQAMERATALDPQNAEAWHQYGWFLYVLERRPEALAAFQRALAIEPGRAITCEHIARLLSSERRFGEARGWIDSAIALDPGQSFYYYQRTITRLMTGDTAGARRDAETSAALGTDYPFWGALAQARTTLLPGDTASARAIEARLLAATRDSRSLSDPEAVLIALVLAAAGAHERALAYLDRTEGLIGVNLAAQEFDGLRSDPRFQRIAAESRPPGGR